MRTIGFLLASIAFAVSPAFAVPTTLTSLVGDKDGFFGTPIADNQRYVTDLGGVFFADYRSPSDIATAPRTDIWDSSVDKDLPMWDHLLPDLSMITPVGAFLNMYIAGVADIGDALIDFNGEPIATLSFPGQFEQTHLLNIPVPLHLLDIVNHVILDSIPEDGYIIDFSELVVNGALDTPSAVVPEPPSSMLLATGLFLTAIFATASRRKLLGNAFPK